MITRELYPLAQGDGSVAVKVLGQNRWQQQPGRHARADRGTGGAVRLLRQLRGTRLPRSDRRDAYTRRRDAGDDRRVVAARTRLCRAVGRRDPPRADRPRAGQPAAGAAAGRAVHRPGPGRPRAAGGNHAGAGAAGHHPGAGDPPH
ncbi:hypothetical protein G6F61_013745 [Rhizopus arrhizus]|nr:hypothetical protein G6F61_013745 [Rhizopus arrhizus]